MLSGARREPDPPCHEDAEYVSVRKQSDIAANSADLGDDPIHPRTHLLWHFAARATVAENQPAGRLLVDLLRASAPRIRRSSIRPARASMTAAMPRPAKSQVSRARRIGLTKTRANASCASTGRNLSASRRPLSVKGRSVVLVCLPLTLHAVSPCRITNTSTIILRSQTSPGFRLTHRGCRLNQSSCHSRRCGGLATLSEVSSIWSV